MGYELFAVIYTSTKSALPPVTITLASFGIRTGEEVFSHKFDMGNFESIRGKFRGMQNKTPNKQKPMTFTWLAPSTGNDLPKFQEKSLSIVITLTNTGNKFQWKLVFEKVFLYLPKPDVKEFPGNFNRKDERRDCLFTKFIDDKE